jgi:hypothetical protein
MSKITYKNLYSLTVSEIEKRLQFNNKTNYRDQTSRTSVSPNMDGSRLDAGTAELVTSIQDLLSEALPQIIIQGLIVEATEPISSNVTVSGGKGAVGGVLYSVDDVITLQIPFDATTEVFYINLYKDNITIDRTDYSDRLKIAKIVIPNPGVTSLVQDTKDNSWNAYIVNFTEYKLYGYNDRFEEDSIELLRDNIGEILADNLIGNIRLSEDLKITNTQGTLELDSVGMRILDDDERTLAKFNRNGVFLYNLRGVEIAKFTGSEAKIGNIKILENSIQSGNFLSGSSGFQLKDDGNVEFNNMLVRGTIYALAGEIGGWTIADNELYATTTGIIRTSSTAGSGNNGVVLDKDGLRVYDDILGLVVNLPSDGSVPTFSSGIINEVIFEISTNAVLRTSETVGDGSVNSAGILINNTGIYGCESNQFLNDANLKVLVGGDIYLKGEIVSIQGTIGNVTITPTSLSGGLIEGSTLRGTVIETSVNTPRVRIDINGLYYQTSTNIVKYGSSESGSYGFKYGDGTHYGSGVLAYLFNSELPVLSVTSETPMADIRLYDRTDNPNTGSHEIGDLIVVDGFLSICATSGSPGTFKRLYKEGYEAYSLVLENRISDPIAPSTGQIWLRTDI